MSKKTQKASPTFWVFCICYCDTFMWYFLLNCGKLFSIFAILL